MALNIVVDIPATIGSIFKFKEFRNKKKFNSDEIVGTSIVVFDSLETNILLLSINSLRNCLS